MKKRIKCLLALSIAAAITLLGAMACYSAQLGCFSMEGSIQSGDEEFTNIEVPTGIFVMKPYGNEEQITSADNPQAIKNTHEPDGSDTSIAYDVGLVGYSLTIDAQKSILIQSKRVAASAYQVTKTRQAYFALQVGSSMTSDPTGLSEANFNALFSSPIADEILIGKTSEDYNPDAEYPVYKKLYDSPKVTVKPGEFAPVRVIGTANPNADWFESDQIKITPVFKITPNLTVR